MRNSIHLFFSLFSMCSLVSAAELKYVYFRLHPSQRTIPVGPQVVLDKSIYRSFNNGEVGVLAAFEFSDGQKVSVNQADFLQDRESGGRVCVITKFPEHIRDNAQYLLRQRLPEPDERTGIE